MLKIGDKVQRMGSNKDYTTGRIGVVVELDDLRARVLWTADSNGDPIRVRTWVSGRFLKIIESAD